MLGSTSRYLDTRLSEGFLHKYFPIAVVVLPAGGMWIQGSHVGRLPRPAAESDFRPSNAADCLGRHRRYFAVLIGVIVLRGIERSPYLASGCPLNCRLYCTRRTRWPTANLGQFTADFTAI